MVSDDASTDNSIEVLKEYAVQYPDKIKPIYNTQNLGYSGNRERTLKACKGKYIAILDADDLAESTRISEQVSLMEANEKCTLCYANVYVLRGENKSELFFQGARIPRVGDYKTLLLYDNFIPSTSVMVRASALDTGGYHFKAGFTHSEGHFYARVTRHGQIMYIDKILGSYRQHNASAMTKAKGTKSKVRLDKENALKAMYKEFTNVRVLTRYALARLYVDGFINSIKQKDVIKLFYLMPRLIWLFPESKKAFINRRKGKYTLQAVR